MLMAIIHAASAEQRGRRMPAEAAEAAVVDTALGALAGADAQPS
jgi:hypothetical protein